MSSTPAGKVQLVHSSEALTHKGEAESVNNQPDQPQEEQTKANKPRKQKTPTPPWVPASRPPTFGLAYMWWWIYATFGLHRFPNVRVPNFVGNYQKVADRNIAFVYKMRDKIMGIVTVAAMKGGTGKTTAATWLSSYISKLIDLVTLIFDADTSNTAAGRRHGVELEPGKHLESRQMAALILKHDFEPTKSDLTSLVASDPLSQVYVLPNLESVNIAAEEMNRIAETLKPATDVTVIDTAPGRKEQNTVGAIEASSVTILVAHHNAADDIHGVKNALSYEPYNLRGRTDGHTTIIVLNSVQPEHFNRRTQYEAAKDFGVEPEQVVMIPYEKWLYKSGRVDPSKVSVRAHFAWSWLLRTVAEANCKFNEANPREPVEGEAEVRKHDFEKNAQAIFEKPTTPNQLAPTESHEEE